MPVRSGKDLAISTADELFNQYCQLRADNPLEPLTTILTRISQEKDIDVADLHQAADAQLWEHRYREMMLLTSADIISWAKSTAPMRHIQIILEMQRLALEKLALMDGKDVRTAEEARRLAHTGIEMERLFLGQATSIGATITDAELDDRIKWLQERLKNHEDRIIEGEIK